MSDPKIPCFVLIYEQVDIIEKCLTFLTKYSSRLQIIVVENHSPNTEKTIKPFVMNLLNKNLIWKYYLFEKNITNNAFDIILNLAKDSYLDPNLYPYTMITDGDLTIDDEDWLDEQVNILKKYPNTFVSATTLDMINLPLKTMPNARSWIPPEIDRDDYIESYTGMHLVLFRTQQLRESLNYLHDTRQKFLDTAMQRYCTNVMKMQWAHTKKAKAYHLTWDLYMDLNHPYTQMKLKTRRLWNHSNISPYALYEK